MVRLTVLVALLVSAACGSSPVAPTPAPPAPPTDPHLQAVTDSLVFGTLTPDGWPYTARATNAGPGCATRVRGSTRFYEQHIVVLTLPWTLDSARVIRPGETFELAGCCVGTDRADRELGWNLTFEWETVRC